MLLNFLLSVDCYLATFSCFLKVLCHASKITICRYFLSQNAFLVQFFVIVVNKLFI